VQKLEFIALFSPSHGRYNAPLCSLKSFAAAEVKALAKAISKRCLSRLRWSKVAAAICDVSDCPAAAIFTQRLSGVLWATTLPAMPRSRGLASILDHEKCPPNLKRSKLIRSTSECEHESLVEQGGHHQRDIQKCECDRACKNKPHPSWPILQSPLFDRQANKPETIAQLVENRVYHTWHSSCDPSLNSSTQWWAACITILKLHRVICIDECTGSTRALFC